MKKMISRVGDEIYQGIAHALFHFKSRKKKFIDIYRRNGFGGQESLSGPGSGIEQTQAVREALPEIVREYHIRSFVDAPCGDFHWMGKVALEVDKYIGIDIVPDLIKINRQKYGSVNREFHALDIVVDKLPSADLIMSRDCFIHLSFRDIRSALRNFQRAGYKYILTTTFPGSTSNVDILTGRVRVINLQKPPFSFPKPLLVVNERCAEAGGSFADKSLALWTLPDIEVN